MPIKSPFFALRLDQHCSPHWSSFCDSCNYSFSFCTNCSSTIVNGNTQHWYQSAKYAYLSG